MKILLGLIYSGVFPESDAEGEEEGEEPEEEDEEQEHEGPRNAKTLLHVLSLCNRWQLVSHGSLLEARRRTARRSAQKIRAQLAQCELVCGARMSSTSEFNWYYI